MAITEISVSKIYILATEPTNKVKDRFWFDTTNNLLKRYDGTSWKPISVSSDDVVVLSSGNKISLTNYLNTQIAALAEGIDSKQDKLTFYYEDISTNQEASIQHADSFSIKNTNQGLILDGNNGGITIENSTIEDQDVISIEGNSFGAGRGIISIANNIWSGDSILFNIEGTSIKISDALLIPEIKNKQNKLLCYSETIPTDKSYPEEVVITAKGQNFLAANGAGTITLLATNSTDSGDDFAPGTINLNASKVLKNGEDIATTGDLATKQNTLNYYSEASGRTPSATISVANIKLTGKVAEGSGTTASGDSSHAEGYNTRASGYTSHAEGLNTTASGDWSHAEGFGTTALGSYQHVQGIGNIEDSNNKYADIIGNGYYSGGDEIDRSNAATVSWEGISWSKTDVRAGGTDQDNATHSLAAKQNATDNNLATTDKTIVGAINELLASINANVITSTEQKRITTTSTASGIQMSTTAKTCMVSINPVKTNVGAIYISTSSDTAPTINPLYPDQMPKYKFPDASQVYIWSDVNGDSVDLTIEYYG